MEKERSARRKIKRMIEREREREKLGKKECVP
jgi:hypothetical protein